MKAAAHRASCRREGWKNWDGGGILRRGGCSGGRRGPASGWEGRGSLGAGVPRAKGGKGVLRAPLTVEWVATAEAVEVPTIGRLLAARSCTDGEKVVSGENQLRRKMCWCGNAGKVAVRWPYRWRSGA
jgi:hypothetical protein